MNYQKQKAEFLDFLQPDDFRNPGSFNQVEEIIDELRKAAIQKQDRREFIFKAASHLFRENSAAVTKLIDLILCE